MERRVWPSARELPMYLDFTPCDGADLARIFPAATASALTLLDTLLMYDPSRRCDATHALSSEFFNEDPSPTEPSQLVAYKRSLIAGSNSNSEH